MPGEPTPLLREVHLHIVQSGMRTFILLFVAVWFVCGLAGAWMMGLDRPDAMIIARGPFTLAKAFSETPESSRLATDD